MPRPRLRLATLALLVVIIALAVALLVQRRRESAMLARMKMIANDNEVLQSIVARQERLRQIELEKLGPPLRNREEIS